jgi:hypothetical protein
MTSRVSIEIAKNASLIFPVSGLKFPISAYVPTP